MPLTLTRSLLVVLIPGVVAFAPWLLWAVREFTNVGDLYRDFPEAVTVAVFAAVVVFGTIVEGFNSWIETRWDSEREKDYDVRENWYAYLARVCSPEPVGHGYISRMFTTMYFELAMMWALPTFGLGIIILNATSATADATLIACIAVISILLAVSFYHAGKESHLVLCNVRRQINQRIDKIGAKF
jgi:hypothetical protein